MFHGRLLDNNSHGCESVADLPYPVVLLQGRKSGGDRFIECLGGDLYGVLNVSYIFYRNCARSVDHKAKRSIFVFCSPQPNRQFCRASCGLSINDQMRMLEIVC